MTEEKLRESIRMYSAELTAYIFGYVKNRGLSEELMTDCFAELYIARVSLRSEDKLRPYLYRIARTKALRAAKRYSLELPLGEDLPESGQDDEERAELRAAVRAALSRLKSEYARALTLVCMDGMSYAEAAGEMEKSPRQIKNLVFRGKKKLKEALEKEGCGND